MDYFQTPIPHDKLSLILNSIGLEVESYEAYQEIKGGLKGLVTGEVLTVDKHPNADRLSVTTVNIGNESPLQIVCGAPNVATGQKVIVAPVGTTIFPTSGDSITMKAAKIRGVESMGMICAEDEIGLGTDHNGIKILDPNTTIGIAVADLFEPYDDHVISIGLTPNRSDAMSHLGVARDVCNWLNHHEGTNISPLIKLNSHIGTSTNACPLKIQMIASVILALIFKM
jgi:phenylalanyl-tRNA synthetase beta chain